MMREFLDCNGIPLSLMEIRGCDAYEGMLEGTPFLCRKWRLITGRDALNEQGVYVHGLDALEVEIASLDSRSDVWPPCEKWSARLHGCDDWEQKVRYELRIIWYQGAVDPMQEISAIISDLDFKQYCKQIPIDLDD